MTVQPASASEADARLGSIMSEGDVLPFRHERPGRTPLTVVIVDGSYGDFLQTRRSLQKVGGSRFFIAYADSLEAGYELLSAKNYDVGLVAAELGRHSGLELIRRLGGRDASTPLILLTEGIDADLDAAAMRAGAIDYLDKNEMTGSVLERTIRYARHTHALESRLHEAVRRVTEANAAKSDFLARMSHDLRTPLNAILGFSEVVRDQMYGRIGSAKYVEYAGHIHESGRHLLTLINDILDLSKIEAGRLELTPEVVEPADVISESVNMIRAQATRKGIAVVTGLDCGVVPVVADRRAVKQMLVNLLSNAVKFTPPGGRIGVDVSLGAGGLCISVSDTGAGIPPEELDAVLQPFGQGRQPIETRQEGAGLGLAIVRTLIEMHGGRLDIRSRVSHGTTVTLAFPRNRLTARV